MKIIDEKGKLFSIINIIDLLVILFIIGISCIVVIKTSVIKKVNVLENKKSYELQVLAKSVLPVMTEQIEVGDIILEDATNAVLGEVTDIKVETTKNEVPTSDGRVVIADVKTRRDILISVKGTGLFDEKKGLTLGNKDWQAGSAIVVKSSRVKLMGNIYKVDVR